MRLESRARGRRRSGGPERPRRTSWVPAPKTKVACAPVSTGPSTNTADGRATTSPETRQRSRPRSAPARAFARLVRPCADRAAGPLQGESFPFDHPRYIGHQVSAQSLPATIGYFVGLLHNPNNVTIEAAPVTLALDTEACSLIATMLGYDPHKAYGISSPAVRLPTARPCTSRA
jgi:hypothetical protein